jgi:hypothetical protein
MNKLLLASLVGALVSVGAQAAGPVVISSITGSAFVVNAELAGDGYFPPNTTEWTTDTAFWAGDAEHVTFTFDKAYRITGLKLSVDNNDFYTVSLSTDGTTWQTYHTVLAFEGTVLGGMETFTPNVIATADYFRYARISASYGDGYNSVGEVQFSGVAAAVPEPTTVALMLSGLGAVGMLARRRRVA